ncbi:hypothetical protein CVT26_007550, partial [Gymnopilus dilepis]
MARNKTPRVQHDSPKKNRFIGLVLGGQNVHNASIMADIPSSTAADLWTKYKTTGSTKNRPRSGRPKKATDRVKRSIVRNAVKERRKPFRELANEGPGN